MVRTALFALAFLVATPVLAGPGDYREDRLRAKVKDTVTFRCPTGSKRTVTDAKGSMVETCVTSEGVKNGYFLKWAADGSTWLMVGTYVDGAKDGKWIKFTKDGTPGKVTWYQRGVEKRKTSRTSKGKK